MDRRRRKKKKKKIDNPPRPVKINLHGSLKKTANTESKFTLPVSEQETRSTRVMKMRTLCFVKYID